MATTTSEAFDQLHSWLTPTETETTAAASHRESIRLCLEANLGMTNFFRSGSFGHGTSLSGISDVDYMAVFPRNRLHANSQWTLNIMRDALAARFPRTAVSVSSPAVVVPFGNNDSERHEITPGDLVGNSNGSNIYEIPNRATGWMRTSPHAHGNWINAVNTHLPGTKAIIRFIKLWNHMNNVGLRSFYIEMRVAEYCRAEKVIDRPFDVVRALNHLRQQRLSPMYDPTGLCGEFQACDAYTTYTAPAKLEQGVAIAMTALDYVKANNHRAAIAEYHKLFNGYFPSYG